MLIPQEVFVQILSRLPINDLLNCRLVCRNWKDEQAIFYVLRKCHKPIHFRTNNEVKYFTWLMRTTHGTTPFSKFAFEFDQDIALSTVQDFLKSTEVTGISLIHNIRKRWTFRDPDLKVKSDSWGIHYGQSVHTLLFSTSNLTSLYLVVNYGCEFPATDEASCAQTFRGLKKFKVKFALDFCGSRTAEPALFENIIKHSPRLQVLSLLYYPYFCEVDYNYPGIPLALTYEISRNSNFHEQTMNRTEMQKLPNFLRLLRSPSTKVKLRLGIITNAFQNVCTQLVALNPQPRIVALAISLPTELDLALKSSIWNWIQTLPLSKLKFFQNESHYDDFPELSTNPFYSVHQLRLTSVTNITSNDSHLLFPNLTKLSVYIRTNRSGQQPLSLHSDFDAFYSLVTSLPHLEHLKISGTSWEVLTGEPYRNNLNRHRSLYVLRQIENLEGRTFGVAKNPIQEIKKLKYLELDFISDGICSALYASATGRLQRLQRLTFVTHDDPPVSSNSYDEKAMNLIQKYHDNVVSINVYIK